MALSPIEVENIYDATRKLLELWMRIKLILQKSFSEGAPTSEQENTYLQIKSEISRIYRGIAEKIPRGLQIDGDKMMEMLKNAMTMEHLGNQPLTERQIYYSTWHRVYLKLTRTLGALEVMKSGYYPHLHRDRLREPAPARKK